MVSGFFQFLSGMFIVLDKNRLSDLPDVALSDTGLIWFGVDMMLLGAFSIFLASSILSAQKWARVWYAVIGTLNIVTGFWLVITHGGEARWTGLATAIFWVVILQLLFNDKSDKYFED